MSKAPTILTHIMYVIYIYYVTTITIRTMIIVILLNVAMDNNQYSYDLMCKSSTRRPCSIAMLLHSLYIVWNIKLYNTHINILYDNVRHLNSWKPSFIVFIIYINLYPISYSHHLVIGRIYIYIWIIILHDIHLCIYI